MHRRAVEAFGKVLGEQLPVRLHVGDDALADAQVLQAVALELPVELADVERRASPRQVDEHEAAPLRSRDAVEREILQRKSGVSMRRGVATSWPCRS